MKPVLKHFTKGSVAEQLYISAKEAYERVNESCNNFLKTQKGLQYLLLKFPNDLVVNAIKEFRTNTKCTRYKF